MKRMSVSKRRVSVLPSGFVAVPVPWTSATPMKPLKSVIDEGSRLGPKKVRENVTPLIVVVLVVGLGAGLGAFAASAAPGLIRPAPTTAPAAPAAPPMNARRDSACRTWRHG